MADQNPGFVSAYNMAQQKKPIIKDVLEASWCPNAAEPAFSIEFPVGNGKRLLIAEHIRKCRGHPFYSQTKSCFNCPKTVYANPDAYRLCPDNKTLGEESFEK